MNIREFRDQLFRELDKREANHQAVHDAAHEALLLAFDCHHRTHADMEKARDLSQENIRHRLEWVAELREQVNHQAGTFAQTTELRLMRQVHDSVILKVQEAILELEKNKCNKEDYDRQEEVIRRLELGISNLQARLYTVTGILGIAMTLASILLAVFR